MHLKDYINSFPEHQREAFLIIILKKSWGKLVKIANENYTLNNT